VNFNWVVQKGFRLRLRKSLNLRGRKSRHRVVHRLQVLDHLNPHMRVRLFGKPDTLQTLTEAYGEAELIGEFVLLARALKRLPTDRDLRLEAHPSAEFPDASTFRKFGQKAELVKRVMEYCRSREGHEDIVVMCEAHSPRKDDGTGEHGVHVRRSCSIVRDASWQKSEPRSILAFLHTRYPPYARNTLFDLPLIFAAHFFGDDG
jgi:hypothetical protein